MKYNILIFIIIAVLIVGVSIYGISSQNFATYNGPSLQTYNYNISEVTSIKQTMSIFSNSEENPLDELNTKDKDEPFSLASNGYYYSGTSLKNTSKTLNTSII